jgi:hypothetical protein
LENNKNKNKNVVGELGFYEYADELYLTATKGDLRWECSDAHVGIGAYLLGEVYNGANGGFQIQRWATHVYNMTKYIYFSHFQKGIFTFPNIS